MTDILETYPSKWHALFVLTGKEDEVKERLISRLDSENIRVVVPKRKLKERKGGEWKYKVRTLFPGYILLNGHVGVKEYYSLKNIPGLLRILKDGYQPLEIEQYEINLIDRLVDADQIIGISDIYTNGSKIVVTNGPLSGLEGLIESIDKRKERARVRIAFLGEPRYVYLGISMVRIIK